MNELDEIMSGDGNAVPETQQEQSISQPRDESGRFSVKQEEQPAVVDQPVAEAQPQTSEQAAHAPGIPIAAAQDERKKRQAAEADAEALRREIAELRGMVQARQQPAPQPQQEAQAPASIFEDPEGFLKGQLTPVQQQMQEMREMLWESQATQVHGAEAVAAAKEAGIALFNTPEGQALARKPGNLFDNLVQWHKQQQALSLVGNDPNAWLEAEIEKRLGDQAFQAQYLERIRTGAASNTNRSQPATNLPRSISRLPAGGNMPADNDMSDGAIFSNALR